jgi:hypothetical protein
MVPTCPATETATHQPHRTEARFDLARFAARRPLPVRLATRAEESRTPRRLCLPCAGEGVLLDGETPCMHGDFHLIEGGRTIGQGERRWYHQFHGNLFHVVVTSQYEKVWFPFLPCRVIGFRTLPLINALVARDGEIRYSANLASWQL